MIVTLLLLPLSPAIIGSISTTKAWQIGFEQRFRPSTEVAAEKPVTIPRPVRPNGEINDNDKQNGGSPPQGHPPEQEKNGK
jgi:hypothetical protein